LVKQTGDTVLFGGSFDPPHLGHTEIVRRLREMPGIRRIIVVPAFLNPFKSRSHAPAQKRLEWCRKVFDMPGVEISDFEILRGRPVYTIETLEEMKKLYTISSIVIGADNLASLPQWKDFDILNRTVAWIVATRENERPDASVLKNYRLLPVNVPVSSTDIRAGKGMEYVDPRIRGDVKKYYITKDQT